MPRKSFMEAEKEKAEKLWFRWEFIRRNELAIGAPECSPQKDCPVGIGGYWCLKTLWK
jgi:hypothetical protein